MNKVVDAILGRLGIYRSSGERVNEHATLYLLFDSNSTMDLHETELQVKLSRLT